MKYFASLLVLMSSSLIAQISPPYPSGGGGGGVTTFNARTGDVLPATNDYSFAQLSGQVSVSQQPATTVQAVGTRTANTILKWVTSNTAANSSLVDDGSSITTGENITAPNFIGTLNGNSASSSFATNILGGALGSIPYQSAANTTLFVAGQTVAGTYLLCEQPTGSLIAPILCNLATLMASPGPIGSTTRSTVQATTVNATSTNVGSNIMAGEGVVTFSATPAFTSGTTQSQIMTLTANVTSFTMAAGVAGRGFTLTLCQNATGGFTAVGAPANLRGFGTIGTTPSTCSSQHFVYSGNQTAWLADSAMVINM